MNNKLEPIARDAVAIAKYIKSLIDQGLNRSEVLERLANPADVGAAMIDRAVERRQAGAEYLGRSPDFVMLPAESEDE